MCLVVYGERPKPMVAEEDIITYKVVRSERVFDWYPGKTDLYHLVRAGYTNKYFSPFISTEIAFDKLQTNDDPAVIRPIFEDIWGIYGGTFHVFRYFDEACHFAENSGLPDKLTVITAIIPKGTEYYRGWFGGSSGKYEALATRNVIYKDSVDIDNAKRNWTFTKND